MFDKCQHHYMVQAGHLLEEGQMFTGLIDYLDQLIRFSRLEVSTRAIDATQEL